MKYELLPPVKVPFVLFHFTQSHGLHLSVSELMLRQLRALREITVGNYVIYPGELGGLVYDETCLDQTDDSWVFNGSMMGSNSLVTGNSVVFSSCLHGGTHVISGQVFSSQVCNTGVRDSHLDACFLETSSINRSKLLNCYIDHCDLINGDLSNHMMYENTTVQARSNSPPGPVKPRKL